MDIRATRAEISRAAFVHNLSLFRLRIGRGCKLCLALKGNAYGHGLAAMAQIAEPHVDAFAVATVAEGAVLRQGGTALPILLLSPHLRQDIPLLYHYCLQPVVSSGEFLPDYQQAAQGRLLPLHLKVDTGMGRAGALPAEVLALAEQLPQYSNLRLQGLCTHFASADGAGELETGATQQQLRCFGQVLEGFRQRGIALPCVHAANSAATLRYPQSHFDMVRIGIGAYGYAQASELRPVLRWKSQIALVKRLPRGHKVSYGGTWQVQGPYAVLGLLPVGYADGYSRRLSGCGRVLLGQQSCFVVGRVCMDQVMIDLTDYLQRHPQQSLLEQDVLLLGSAPQLSAQNMAEQLGTIPYEILTSISTRVPRVYID